MHPKSFLSNFWGALHFAPLSFFYLDRKLFLILLDTQQFNFENQSRERFDLAA